MHKLTRYLWKVNKATGNGKKLERIPKKDLPHNMMTETRAIGARRTTTEVERDTSEQNNRPAAPDIQRMQELWHSLNRLKDRVTCARQDAEFDSCQGSRPRVSMRK